MGCRATEQVLACDLVALWLVRLKRPLRSGRLHAKHAFAKHGGFKLTHARLRPVSLVRRNAHDGLSSVGEQIYLKISMLVEEKIRQQMLLLANIPSHATYP